jgi:hypothetical protein
MSKGEKGVFLLVIVLVVETFSAVFFDPRLTRALSK